MMAPFVLVSTDEQGTDTGVRLAADDIFRDFSFPFHVDSTSSDMATQHLVRPLDCRAEALLNYVHSYGGLCHVIILTHPDTTEIRSPTSDLIMEHNRLLAEFEALSRKGRPSADAFERSRLLMTGSEIPTWYLGSNLALRQVGRDVYKRQQRYIIVIGPTESEAPGSEQFARQVLSLVFKGWLEAALADPFFSGRLAKWESETVGYSFYSDDAPWIDDYEQRPRRPDDAYGGHGIPEEERIADPAIDELWKVRLCYSSAHSAYPKYHYVSAHRANMVAMIAAEHPSTCRLIEEFLANPRGTLMIEGSRTPWSFNVTVEFEHEDGDAAGRPYTIESQTLAWRVRSC